ncbi:CCCH zinc finger protein [Aspergillus affinis]|uniref:CCCH zinc finger protein n=1 Tax=Aspergillus affinis TaxID=1070780 RepID=UPI0022FEBB86|nr:uncharacterized protein KD926_000509 [Aspergillus affinis]KAI9044598.1 hypothetical protein KD926_000509 [Aspergillus affinis]
MNPQGFSFPPPPPPPPPSRQQTQQQSYNQQHAAYPSQYGQNQYGQRGGRGGGGNHRGRGRGYGNRGGGGGGGGGGGRGGHYMPVSTNVPSVGYAPMNYAGFASQPVAATQQPMPTPQFTPAQSQNFQNHHNAAGFPSQQPYSQPHAAHGSSYQRRPSYDAAYAPSTTQSAPMYPPVMPTPQHTAASAPPPMMGPPMRWGFENAGSAAGGYPAPHHGNQRGGRSFNTYNNNHNNNQAPQGAGPSHHPNKRDHTSAFGKPRATGPRVPAPPPVPSFGNPLPSKPPPPVDTNKKPKKKKRKHNQLGLTPKTDEHESSEEEDDVDEEARLAPAGAGAVAPLQFTYKGHTATLQTPAEIAAWIAERKKRFPTQSRIEEKKKAMEEAKKARQEALRQKDMQKQESKRPQKDVRSQKEQPSSSADPVDAAAKAKQKADKLRRKLMKEQKRVEKAEADAERARMKVEQLQKGTTGAGGEAKSLPQQAQTQGSTDKAQDTAPGLPGNPSEHSEVLDKDAETTEGASTLGVLSTNQSQGLSESIISVSDASDSGDWTSSSGSESSDSDSDSSDDDDDSAPEEISSRREGPERVPPPPREVKKRLCRHFARNGRCLRGDQCKFLHEAPQRPAKAKPVEKKGRKGLLQAVSTDCFSPSFHTQVSSTDVNDIKLLGRQKEEDDRKVMEAIMWLGENGHLEAPPASEPPVQKTDDMNAAEDATQNQGVSGAPVPEPAVDGSASTA